MICPIRGCEDEYMEGYMPVHFLTKHQDRVEVKEEIWTGLEKAAWDAVNADAVVGDVISGNFELDCNECGRTLSATSQDEDGKMLFYCTNCPKIRVWVRKVNR